MDITFTQEELIDLVVKYGSRLLIAAIILFLGFKIANILGKTVARLLDKRDSDKGLVSFLKSLTSAIIKTLTIVTALSQLGIEMTSFVAILGAAGLAIGMAFSGTLSNLAGGVMILLFKPYKVGDFIEAQGESGSVKEIQIFHTILTTPDNKTIIIPNGSLANGNLTNFSTQDTRRVTLTFGFGYGEELQLAKDTIMEIIEKNDKILKDPAPFIGLAELGNSSVNLTVHAWVNKADFWEITFYLNETVYERFTEVEGLSIPFPQMDLNLKKD